MLRQLKYFQAVVRRGSFTEAAVECHISQSAISQQIQALEQSLGVSLLQRGNRKFTLTPAGEYFYQKSLLLTADFETLCRETARMAHQGDDQLRVGYLKGYGGPQFQTAVAEFSAEFPDMTVQIVHGNHEELYDALRSGQVDLVLSDQRRAFSDEYVNLVLTTSECSIEIARQSLIAQRESVEITDLRDIPCVLVASRGQQEIERAYYRDVVGLRGEFLFAENLEEARLQVLGGKGFLPVEGEGGTVQLGTTLRRIPLTRNGKPIKRTYCAFWKADCANDPIERFAEILQSKF
jgi:DNA-binding transcriptional LysR family regulator